MFWKNYPQKFSNSTLTSVFSNGILSLETTVKANDMSNAAELRNMMLELQDEMKPGIFREYLMGFSLYRELSRDMTVLGNRMLKEYNLLFEELDETRDRDKKILMLIRKNALKGLGYYIKPDELFENVAAGSRSGGFVLEELDTVAKSMNPDFDAHFEKFLKEAREKHHIGKTGGIQDKSDYEYFGPS